MTHQQFITRQCSNSHCRFRFPVLIGEPTVGHCPLCGHRLIDASVPFTNSDGPKAPVDEWEINCAVMLDNVRSAMNVGSIIRSCDCTGVHHIYLCGVTPTPENPKVRKTSLHAESSVSWSYHRNALDQAESLRNEGYSIWALETSPASMPLYGVISEPIQGPIVLVCGNEKAGVDPGIQALSDSIVSLPLIGIKSSMNVAVAAGAALSMLAAAKWV